MLAILNNVLPVFVIVLLGHGLKRAQIANEVFFRTSDRLVYFIFFPSMLFWKIGTLDTASPESQAAYSASALVALGLATVSVWALTMAYKHFRAIPPFQAGAVSQTGFRFNTYVGMAIVLNTYGETGAVCFGILIGLLIPLNNLLAVGTLVWFGQGEMDSKKKVWIVTKGLISNPLILGCVSGMLFSKMGRLFAGVCRQHF